MTIYILGIIAIILYILNLILMIKNKQSNYRIQAILYSTLIIIFMIYLIVNYRAVEDNLNYIRDLETTVNELRFEKEYIEYVEQDNIKQEV